MAMDTLDVYYSDHPEERRSAFYGEGYFTPLPITVCDRIASKDSWYICALADIPELKLIEITCEDAWIGDAD